MSTIVAGFDGQDGADRVLDRAIEEARTAGALLVVLAVVEMPLNPEGPQNFGSLDDTPASMIPLVQPPELEPVLAAAREQVEPSGVAAEYAWAVGNPAEAIVGEATDRNAAAVVLGHHHHGLLARLLGGDVAAEVRRAAGCAVIVVD